MAICNNKKCSLGECDQPETCAAYVPVITRADKIRAMTDEELSKVLRGPFCNNRTHKECFISYRGNCNQCILDWLHQPAEEGTV